MKRQRCAYHEDGHACSRYITADWQCIECGLPVCQQHCQSITFATGSTRGSAPLCFACMHRLAPTLSDELGHVRIRRAYSQMLGLAIQRQYLRGIEETRAAVAKLEAANDPEATRKKAVLVMQEEIIGPPTHF